jgi:polyhydroxyalkanoate synthesis regulator phasin
MAQSDLLKRYLDAGMAFTAMTQARAEAIVRDLVKAGEVQADQARDAATELLERSRRNTDRLIDTIRKEVRVHVANLGLATQADVARLVRRIDAATPGARAAAPARPASKAAKRATKATKAKRATKATKATKARATKATRVAKATRAAKAGGATRAGGATQGDGR